MKLVKKIFSLGLLAAIPVVSLAITEIGVTSKANAVPFGAATVYKVTQSGISSVYLSGTANSKIEVDLGSTPKTTARVVGSCGEVKIAVPTSGSFAGLKVDGTSIDTASLPIQTLPTCISGAFSEARPANFKTPNGQVVIVGKTAGSAATIALPSDEFLRIWKNYRYGNITTNFFFYCRNIIYSCLFTKCRTASCLQSCRWSFNNLYSILLALIFSFQRAYFSRSKKAN
jgi:hypothetical protein